MQKLIFIYNAKSGLLADVAGALLKILKPVKYHCALCKITYGIVSVKDDWRVYLATLPQQKIFLHNDELVGEKQKYAGYSLPVILLETSNTVSELVTEKDFRKIKTTQDLIETMDRRLMQ